ncbi:hypothetical protein PTKIN_Ptkin01aG0344900 [Pterospermum kingtungense]
MGQPQSRSDRKPQPGDHIYCRRSGRPYDHHGIYVGDDMVIHLRGAAKKLGPPSCEKCLREGKCNGEIAKSCLDCFLEGEPVLFVDYGPSTAKPAHEVIKTAYDFLENNDFGRYDMLTNNCEDFAVYCKTGRAFSSQAFSIIASTGAVFPVAGVVIGGAYGIAKAITEAQRRR